MKRLLRSAVVAMVAGSIGSGAAAQRLGNRIGKDADTKDGRDVAQMMADCWVERQPARARQWMQIVPGSPEEQKLFADLREFETCLQSDSVVMDNKSLRFKPAALRRPVAIKLVKDGLHRGVAASAPTSIAPLAWFASGVQAGGQYDASALSMQEFGQCVATADWANSVAMLRAVPDSSAEIGAFRALAPSFGPCVPSNERVSLTRQLVRQVLAEPLYHLLAAPRGRKS